MVYEPKNERSIQPLGRLWAAKSYRKFGDEVDTKSSPHLIERRLYYHSEQEKLVTDVTHDPKPGRERPVCEASLILRFADRPGDGIHSGLLPSGLLPYFFSVPWTVGEASQTGTLVPGYWLCVTSVSNDSPALCQYPKRDNPSGATNQFHSSISANQPSIAARKERAKATKSLAFS